MRTKVVLLFVAPRCCSRLNTVLTVSCVEQGFEDLSDEIFPDEQLITENEVRTFFPVDCS